MTVSVPYVTSCSLLTPPPPRSTLFPYTTLFRSKFTCESRTQIMIAGRIRRTHRARVQSEGNVMKYRSSLEGLTARSEEHTSELQSRQYLVCRLLLEKK